MILLGVSPPVKCILSVSIPVSYKEEYSVARNAISYCQSKMQNLFTYENSKRTLKVNANIWPDKIEEMFVYTFRSSCLNKARFFKFFMVTKKCTINIVTVYITTVCLCNLYYYKYTISQQIHCSGILLKFYSTYMFRRLYVIIREPAFVCPTELH
jgi:hypothetical protein